MNTTRAKYAEEIMQKINSIKSDLDEECTKTILIENDASGLRVTKTNGKILLSAHIPKGALCDYAKNALEGYDTTENTTEYPDYKRIIPAVSREEITTFTFELPLLKQATDFIIAVTNDKNAIFMPTIKTNFLWMKDGVSDYGVSYIAIVLKSLDYEEYIFTLCGGNRTMMQ